MMLAKGGANLNHTHRATSSAEKNTRQDNPGQPKVYAMRGWLGIFSQGMDKLAQQVRDKWGYQAEAMSYHEKDQLIQHITHNYRQGKITGDIILVGHSFGADAQVEVARALGKINIPVRLLIAVEPTRKQTISSNVSEVYQLASGTSFPKRLLGWDAPFDKANSKTIVKQIDLATGKGAKNMHHFNMTTYPKTLRLELALIKQATIHSLPRKVGRAHG